MREYREYRQVLEQLISTFGNKGWLTLAEVASYDGCDPRTAAKRYRIAKGAGGIDIAVLATRKCELAH